MSTIGSPALAEVLVDTAQLEVLVPEWEHLWREDPHATPFQSPRWLLPWWRHVGQGQLRGVALRDDEGGLAGFAPLYLYANERVFPVGIATTDYLSPLTRPGWERALAEAVVDHRDGSKLEFPQLREGDALLTFGPVSAGEPNPVLALKPSPAIPKPTLANLRTCRNRAARAGQVTYDRATADDIPAYLDALARLHGRRWTERGLPGVLQDGAVRAMHAEAAPLLHAAGLLRLYGLRLDGDLIAVLYALADDRRHFYYIAGFDPVHAFFSPGSLLLAHAIEQAAAEGATEFDFLRGAEPYKYRWGALDQPMFTLRLGS